MAFIEKWFKGVLSDLIELLFTAFFDSINANINSIPDQISQTPSEFNPDIFSMVKVLSETVIIPIGGVILMFVVCYELIHMVLERNNMNDFDSFIFFKWLVKTAIAIFVLTHTFDFVMGTFDLAKHAMNKGAGVITGEIDLNMALDGLIDSLSSKGIPDLLLLCLDGIILFILSIAIRLYIFFIIYSRMVEIYLRVSLAPIPLATMANKEWSNMGISYLKGLFAIAFQGFLIVACIAIFTKLTTGLVLFVTADGAHSAIWVVVGYTILLCAMLKQTGTIANGIFGTH